jgi:hypothetical protein
VFWTIVAAALAAVLLIWLFTATSVRALDSIDTSAVPSEAQPVTPPAPRPAMRPAPAP